jgi:hypothetical protein
MTMMSYVTTVMIFGMPCRRPESLRVSAVLVLRA